MNIPDKAVEAAARVFYASQTSGDNLDTSYNRKAWLRIAERALADAAPAIMAQALRDEADLIDALPKSTGPERVRAKLRAGTLRLRADKLEMEK